MVETMLTHVHYGETLCGWQYRSKGEAIELLEKEKEKEVGDRTLCWLGPDPGEGESSPLYNQAECGLWASDPGSDAASDHPCRVRSVGQRGACSEHG